MRQLFASVFLVLTLFSLAPTAGAGGIATARKVSGDVRFRPAGRTPYGVLAGGTSLPAGSSVRTGRNGWVELRLEDGSTVTLANDTELELTSLTMTKGKKEGLLNFAQGKLRASVVKLAGQQADIRVRSKTAVAGVRGTEFLMLNVGPANVFFGNEGSVAVSGETPDSRLMGAGTMTQTTRGYVPMEPVEVEQGSPLADARATFNAVTGPTPPTEWLAGDNLPSIIARWDINYGHYLADRGDYEEALQVFQAAIDLTKTPEIRADAWLERGTVHGRFLNNPRAALAEYLLVLEEYPRLPQVETALYSVGQTLFDLQLFDQARIRLRQYLATYPAGRFRGTVETLLQQLGDKE
jgi:hypothetical protein